MSVYGIFSFTREHSFALAPNDRCWLLPEISMLNAQHWKRLLLLLPLPWLSCATNVVACNCCDTLKAANLLQNTTFPLINSIYSNKREKHKLLTATLTATACVDASWPHDIRYRSIFHENFGPCTRDEVELSTTIEDQNLFTRLDCGGSRARYMGHVA